MTTLVSTVLGASTTIKRQHTARLADEIVVMPAYKSLTDASGNGDADYDTFDDLGFDTPDAAPSVATNGAGNVDGTRGYLITFYDSERGAESNPYDPDNPATVVASNNAIQLTFQHTNEDANSRWDKIRVYRNDSDNGTTYYLLGTADVGDATYDDDATDASIRTADSIELNNDKPAAGVYDFCLAHKGRMFLIGQHDFIFSKTNKPWSYPTENRAKVERGRHGIMRLATPIGDILVHYKDDATYELHYDKDPHGITGDGYGKTMTTERGCLNDRTAINFRGTHYVLDYRGIYQSRGGTEENNISLPLEGVWNRINWAQKDKFGGVLERDRAIWTVALDGESECRYGLVLDLQSIMAGGKPKWYVSEYAFGIRDMCRMRMDGSATPVQFGMEWQTISTFVTEYGQVGYLVAGYTDLVDPQLDAEGTVTGGSTTTLEDSNGTFSRTNEAGDTVDVKGAYITFPTLPDADKPGSEDWSQKYRITGVSGTTLTVSPNFPSAPPTGATYHIGGIPNARLETPLMSFGSPHIGKQMGNLIVEHQPGGDTFEIGYGFKLDRRGISRPTDTRDEGYYRTVANEELAYMEFGGTLANDGRLGVQKYGGAARNFHYAQLIIDASGPNRPAIINAHTLMVANAMGV